MGSKPNAYNCFPLHPTATTVYQISEFTSTLMQTTDEYRVLVEHPVGNVAITNKQLTFFTVLCASTQSPADQVTIWLEFMDPVSRPVPVP